MIYPDRLGTSKKKRFYLILIFILKKKYVAFHTATGYIPVTGGRSQSLNFTIVTAMADNLHTPTVRKPRVFLSHLDIKRIILPRQARDKHIRKG